MSTCDCYVFAYDVCCPWRSRRVLHCLRAWRIDGQLSVHEARLHPGEAIALAADLVRLIDREQDSLLVARLRGRGGRPWYRLATGPRATPILGAGYAQDLPREPAPGWFLFAYDVADPKRGRSIHRTALKSCAWVQRSLLLFSGSGFELRELGSQLLTLLDRSQDDLRVYALAGPGHLWILGGKVVPLAQFAADGCHRSTLHRFSDRLRRSD